MRDTPHNTQNIQKLLRLCTPQVVYASKEDFLHILGQLDTKDDSPAEDVPSPSQPQVADTAAVTTPSEPAVEPVVDGPGGATEGGAAPADGAKGEAAKAAYAGLPTAGGGKKEKPAIKLAALSEKLVADIKVPVPFRHSSL